MMRKYVFIILLSIFLCLSIISKNETYDRSQLKEYGPKTLFEGKIVFHSNFDGDNEIYILTKNSFKKLTDNNWEDEYPVWSPDGTTIAFTSNRKGNYDIYTMDKNGSKLEVVTSFSSDEKEPAWFPDGESIVYSREIKKFLKKQISLYKVSLKTKNSVKLIPGYKKTHAIPHISPNGSSITFTGKKMMGWDSALYDQTTQKITFLEKGGKSCRGRFSKDGKMIAYTSSSSDKKGEICIINSDGTDKRILITREKTYDYFPSWSSDGKFIVFNSSHQHNHNGDWKLYIVEVETGKTILLFDSPGNDVFPDWI